MDDWTDRLAAVNAQDRPVGKLVVAHLHPGDVSTSWQQSFMNSVGFDQQGPQRLLQTDGRMGLISTQAGAGQLDKARNDVCARFLVDFPAADLLMFVDSDMGWDADAFERMAQTMAAHDLPILGGLCFGQRVTGVSAQHAPDAEAFPTLYAWSEADGAFSTLHDYPTDTVVEVAGTGAAFLMIRRDVLEALGGDWFSPVQVGDRTFGEDMSFCLRARRAGFRIHVDTGARTSHRKHTWITEATYREGRAPTSSAVTVVIPAKDRVDLTRSLVAQLDAQGGFSDILIMDNGSTDPDMVAWLAEQQIATVIDSADQGIHEMWNAGIDWAVAAHGGFSDVVLLNNDLILGPGFLRRLVAGLRSQPGMMLASGNYDRRPGSGVMPLRGICAGRYDGTGGLAGFAFAMRAEWVGMGYRFPDDMAWYFGDNDVCLAVERAGGWYGMVLDARVDHLDGGGNTSGSLVGPTFDDDMAAFQARWPDVALGSPSQLSA